MPRTLNGTMPIWFIRKMKTNSAIKNGTNGSPLGPSVRRSRDRRCSSRRLRRRLGGASDRPSDSSHRPNRKTQATTAITSHVVTIVSPCTAPSTGTCQGCAPRCFVQPLLRNYRNRRAISRRTRAARRTRICPTGGKIRRITRPSTTTGRRWRTPPGLYRRPRFAGNYLRRTRPTRAAYQPAARRSASSARR